MHFGLLSIFQNYRDEYDDGEIMRGELALALAAERLGYDSYWATEHHFFGYSMCPDNLQWLAQVPAARSRIKLGTGAVIMPWNDPYRVASKMALLDQQCGGRMLLGFGRGLARREYERFAIPMDEARGRFDQGTAAGSRSAQQGLLRGRHRVLHPPPRRSSAAAHGRLRRSRVLAIGVSPESAVQAAVLGAQLMVLAQQPWEVFKAAGSLALPGEMALAT